MQSIRAQPRTGKSQWFCSGLEGRSGFGSGDGAAVWEDGSTYAMLASETASASIAMKRPTQCGIIIKHRNFVVKALPFG